MTSDLIDRTPPQLSAGVVIPWHNADGPVSADRIRETAGLVEALGCNLAFVRAERIRKVSPAQLLSGGILDRFGEDLEETGCSLAVVDGALTPVQQRNLETRLGLKVIDRTGLILEIFGLRARTKEGQLQVELARVLYERSRLVRTWTHLERQRGGRGFLAGPGETQIESDRRMLDGTQKKLRSDLAEVRRTRGLQRKGRKRSGTRTVALVGYTNSGKSTLFNRLTGADVFAQDMPFATLDPTVRNMQLPALGDTALIDTVGFITDLPTHLVESFQATLEEAMEADLLVHVRDLSTDADRDQKRDVLTVLEQLEANTDSELPPMIEVWNKADRLDPERRAMLSAAAHDADVPPAVLVSSIKGDGIDELTVLIEDSLMRLSVPLSVHLGPADGQARAWLHAQADVIEERSLEDGSIDLVVRLSADRLGRFQSMFSEVDLQVSRDAEAT
ncbi:MAG: GTPase HflX [Hyphomonadaceae bacterium]